VFAQTATPAPAPAPAPAATPAPAPAPKAEESNQQIVISGSRIKRDNFTSPSPLQIIRNDDSAIAGFTSTAEVLQGTAVTGGQGQINNAFGGFVTDGGPGANTIGLRGFTPTRSLVLLNGRRMAPSGTRGSVGAADLNTLPGSIVDRIEVLKDGASSIYGSDAVAGVINIITKKNIDSTTAESRFTLTDGGGGEEFNLSLTSGFVSDRARLSGSYDYSERNALTLGQRDWTLCNTDYRRTSVNGVVGEWGSFDFVDPKTGKPKCYPISGTGSNGVTINTLGTTSRTGVGAPGSVGTSFNRWRPNPAITTGLPGYEGVGGGANNLNVRDTFDPRMLNRSLISPMKNHNLYLQGGIDLTALGDAELYGEFLFNRRDSSQTGYRQLSLDYMKGSPLIPSGLAFSTFLGPTVISNGANVGVRAFIGFGNDTSSQTVDFTRAVVGLRGTLLKTGWDYDVVATHSESKGSYTFESWLIDRMAQSLNVVASGSGFACVNPAGGCVAAPALTPAVIGGQLPADWVNYTFRPVTGVSKYKEDVVSASFTGKLFDLPYGKVKTAVGAEFRKYSIDDTPALDSQTGNLYNLTTSTPTRGSDSAKDLFGEVEIPLLAKLPMAHELSVNLSARWADYKSYGSGSTHKFGATWSPVKWLTLRGTTSTSYRAPALYEQFLGATSGFLSQQNDPCNNWDAPSNAGTVRAANCQSEGLPAGFVANTSIASINSGGAAAGLKAETSKNKTFGIIVQPDLATGWGDVSVSADYFDIKVDNGVARAGTLNILARCYDDPQFRAGGGFCRLVDPRNTTTNQLTVNDSFVNLATDRVKGIDYTARYTNNVGIGKLRLNLSITKFKSQASQLFSDDPIDEVNGTLTSPKYSGTLDVNYTVQDWRFYYGVDWVGSQSSYEYLGQDPATSTYKLSVPNYYLQTVAVSYKGSKWDITAGVRNVANVKPPSISAQAGYNRVGNAPLYSGYDYVGRTMYMNLSKTF
jgi:outer membrane receptor protein involved in Fe transport